MHHHWVLRGRGPVDLGLYAQCSVEQGARDDRVRNRGDNQRDKEPDADVGEVLTCQLERLRNRAAIVVGPTNRHGDLPTGQETDKDPGGAHWDFAHDFEDVKNHGVEQVNHGRSTHIDDVRLLLNHLLNLFATLAENDGQATDDGSKEDQKFADAERARQEHRDVGRVLHEPHRPKKSGRNPLADPPERMGLALEGTLHPTTEGHPKNDGAHESNQVARHALDDHRAKSLTRRCKTGEQQEGRRHRHLEAGEDDEENRGCELQEVELRRRSLKPLGRKALIADVSTVGVPAVGNRRDEDRGDKKPELPPLSVTVRGEEGAESLNAVVGYGRIRRKAETDPHANMGRAVGQSDQKKGACHREEKLGMLLKQLLKVVCYLGGERLIQS